MITRRSLLAASAACTVAGLSCARYAIAAEASPSYPVTHTEAEWRQMLAPDQFAILRKAATERPFTSPLLNEHRRGTFSCVGCDQDLFSSTTKFESGTGWPSFWAPLDKAIKTASDWSMGMVRTEVLCSRCGGHLGHVFDDGPKPTGKRYCMNGVALKFKPVAA